MGYALLLVHLPRVGPSFWRHCVWSGTSQGSCVRPVEHIPTGRDAVGWEGWPPTRLPYEAQLYLGLGDKVGG